MNYCAKGFIHMTELEQLICYWYIYLSIILIVLFIVLLGNIKDKRLEKYIKTGEFKK